MNLTVEISKVKHLILEAGLRDNHLEVLNFSIIIQ